MQPTAGAGTSAVPPTQSGNRTVSASGSGITIVSHASGFLRNRVRFTGSVPSSASGQTVEIERLGHQTNWTWAPTAHATVASDGSFSVVWRANHIGRFAFRAILQSGSGLRAAGASPTVTVTVYRVATATLYGPGFYGKRTACGVKLTRNTIGLANRTLRCGEHVSVYYQGHTLSVPVIDRGPYANGADFDLTMATGRALGITATEQIGAVSLPHAPPSAG
ncbi:MAG TPA: septal ring lytic transglycosylase RlpA family protein [Solirubrobacteraceae bacterium]|nr:septal ring lytic transglycosylase RlpA family protein [Solirubrobacteraceae bacterium]